MTELTLVSNGNRPIRSLDKATLRNEYQELLQGFQKTQERVDTFEKKYKMTTDEFLRRFAVDEFQHTFDFDEWIGESRMLTRLQEKLAQIQGI